MCVCQCGGATREKDVQGLPGRGAEETPAEALAEKRRKVEALDHECVLATLVIFGGLSGTRRQRWSKGSPEAQYQCCY